MSEAENLAIVRRWFEAVNAHDSSRLAETLDEAYVWEAGGTSYRGSEASAAAWQSFFNGFPDVRLEVEQFVVAADSVVARWRMTGTHQGEFSFNSAQGPLRPVAPTGRCIDIPGCSVHEVKHGKIVRAWIYRDTAVLLRQLGLQSSQAAWM